MQVITYEVSQKVRVRKYHVDCGKLCKLLRRQKKSLGLSNKQISQKLNVPLTLVEHWFRQDKSFAVPSESLWEEVKQLLQIKTDEFDKSIMTFEEKNGVYEKGNRIYDEMGISPTITCSEPTEVLVREGDMGVIECKKED